MAGTAADYQAIVDAIDAAILLFYSNGAVIEYDIDGRKVTRDLSEARADRDRYARLVAEASGGGNARNYAVFGGMNG